MGKEQGAIDAAEAGVEFEDVYEPGGWPWLTHQAGWGDVRRQIETRRAGQQLLLHRQYTEDGFDHPGGAEGMTKHSFGAADGRA